MPRLTAEHEPSHPAAGAQGIPRAVLVAFLAAIGGTAVSAYLTYVHYTEPAQLSCPNTGIVNCVRVTTSPQSMLFGFFPVALAGLLFFLTMALITAPPVWARRAAWLRWGRVAGVTVGVGMALYFVGVEFISLRAVCLWCTAAHGLAYVLFVSVLWATLVPPKPVDHR